MSWNLLRAIRSFPPCRNSKSIAAARKRTRASTRASSWIIIAIVAVIGLVIAFAANGDWMNPTQAEKVQQTEFEEQTVPEDIGANENPEAA